MSLKKYALLVDRPDGQLVPINGDLKGLGFEVILATSIVGARDAVRLAPFLSLVAIAQEAADGDAPRFLDELKMAAPALPVIWVSEPGDDAITFQTKSPDFRLHHLVDPQELFRLTEKFLCGHYYPDGLAKAMAARGEDILMRSYMTEAKATLPMLTANRNLQNRLNAMISFSGQDVLGHLLISGSENHLSAIFGRILPGVEPEATDLLDLCGEICNQVLGSVKEYLSHQDIMLHIGVPFYIHGQGVMVHWKGTRPALTVGFEEKAGSIYAEFCLENVDTVKLGVDRPSRIAASDGIVFL